MPCISIMSYSKPINKPPLRGAGEKETDMFGANTLHDLCMETDADAVTSVTALDYETGIEETFDSLFDALDWYGNRLLRDYDEPDENGRMEITLLEAA